MGLPHLIGFLEACQAIWKIGATPQSDGGHDPLALPPEAFDPKLQDVAHG